MWKELQSEAAHPLGENTDIHVSVSKIRVFASGGPPRFQNIPQCHDAFSLLPEHSRLLPCTLQPEANHFLMGKDRF